TAAGLTGPGRMTRRSKRGLRAVARGGEPSMPTQQRLVAIVFAVALFPSNALAMNSAQTFCRDVIARSTASYSNSVAKLVVACNTKRSKGDRPLTDDCN